MKVIGGLPSLRLRSLFLVVRRALAAGNERVGFRLVHFCVQGNHLHLLIEANDRQALSRGIQGLAVRVARAVNRVLQRAGSVFADRYHARALKTPRAVRWALRYVLLNARKHERQAVGAARCGAGTVPKGFVDPCSSAAWFGGFSQPAELIFGARECREDFEKAAGLGASPVAPPQTWLLRVGLTRAGPFGVDEVPG
jgi:REP element-mobilizing transposase RayT